MSKQFSSNTKLRLAFNRIANTFYKNASFYNEIQQRLLSHLLPIKITPKVILVLGVRCAQTENLLKKKFPKAKIILCDYSDKMLQITKNNASWFSKAKYICAAMQQLAIKSQSIDLVFSNLFLPWGNNQDEFFSEIRRILTAEGLVVFSTFGPDTLKELRTSWANVDNHSHVNTFFDVHDIGESIFRVGLKNPIMDVENFIIRYKSVMQLLNELKLTGTKTSSEFSNNKLTGKSKLDSVISYYTKNFSEENGKTNATIEIIFGHAWGNTQVVNKKINQEISIPLTKIRRENRD